MRRSLNKNSLHFPFRLKSADIVGVDSPLRTYPAWQLPGLMKPYQVWYTTNTPMTWHYIYLGAIPEFNLKFDNIHDAVWGEQDASMDWIQAQLSAQGKQDGAWIPNKSGEITLVSTDWRRPKRQAAIRTKATANLRFVLSDEDYIPTEHGDPQHVYIGDKRTKHERNKTADIISKITAPFEIGDRVTATYYIPLTVTLGVVEGTQGTIVSLRRKEALIKWDVFRNQWWVPLKRNQGWVPLKSLTKESSHQSSQNSSIRFADVLSLPNPTNHIVFAPIEGGWGVYWSGGIFITAYRTHDEAQDAAIALANKYDAGWAEEEEEPPQLDSRYVRVDSNEHFAADAQPAVQPTGNAPQQKLIANSMGDFSNMVSPNQVWQSQSGNFLHLQPNFAVTAKDNNRIVMTGVQWRTADNQQLTPSQPNTLIASDFPFTLRRDLMAVTGGCMLKEAASPTYLQEVSWDEFKRTARVGQIWKTANSLIRIDRFLNNASIRRQSRFIRFKGAWTGTDPKALKALMPQKDGTFLNSTAPWYVSRMHSPFLLIREGVFEGLSEDIAQSVPPAEDNAQPEASTPMLGKPQEYPELELEGVNGQEHRQGVYAALKFSADTGPSIQRQILNRYRPDYKTYPIPYKKRPIPTRPKGRPRKVTDTGSRVEALEDIIIPTRGMKPTIIPKGTTGAVVRDNGESVYVVWNDVAESFGTVNKSKVKYSIEPKSESLPEMESLAMLKFSYVIDDFWIGPDGEQVESVDSHAETAKTIVRNNDELRTRFEKKNIYYKQNYALAMVFLLDDVGWVRVIQGQYLQGNFKLNAASKDSAIQYLSKLSPSRKVELYNLSDDTVMYFGTVKQFLLQDVFSSLKFSDIVSQPSQIEPVKAQANGAYQNIAGFLQNGHFHENEDQLAFNIKYYRVTIPDSVSEALSEDNIQAHIDDQTRMELDNFVDDLKTNYPWITDYEIGGRSGGWLHLKVDMSQFGSPYAETVWEVLWQREPDLDSTVELMIEQEEEPEFRIWAGLASAAEAMDTAFNEIDTKVQAAKTAFVRPLESEEFWALYIGQ